MRLLHIVHSLILVVLYYGIACIIDLNRVLLHVISLLRNFTKLLYNFISAALILCQIYLRQLIIYEFHFTALFSNFICNFLYNLTFVGLNFYQCHVPDNVCVNVTSCHVRGMLYRNMLHTWDDVCDEVCVWPLMFCTPPLHSFARAVRGCVCFVQIRVWGGVLNIYPCIYCI